jgi:hypothetical protein
LEIGAVHIGLKPFQSWPSASDDSHFRAQKIAFENANLWVT